MTRFPFFALCALLVACTSSAQTLPSGALEPNAAAPAASSVYAAESCAPGAKSCTPSGGFVQELGGATISDRVANPVDIAFDASGNLYVSNVDKTTFSGNVKVYAAGTGRYLRTIAGYKGVSYALAFSRGGALYVVSHYKYQCCQIKGSVAVYAPGGTRPVRHLKDVGSFPGKPAFDASGNLYVPNFDDFPGFINAYKPGSITPFASISQGIGFPLALAFDSHGLLYVLNGLFSGGTDVTVYAPQTGKPLRTIKAGVTNASAIALDSRDDLYVANHGSKHVAASISVYAPGSITPIRIIKTGVRYPIALAFDAPGNLYVANSPAGTNTVTVYAPGAEQPTSTYRLTEMVTALAVKQ